MKSETSVTRTVVLACAVLFGSGSAMMPTLVAAQSVAVETPNESRTSEVLRRLVTVDLDAVSLKRAIETAAASAGVRVAYQLPLVESHTTPVTIHAHQVALGAVFERILAGTKLRIVGVPGGRLAVVSDAEAAQPSPGVVTGVVTDEKSKRALSGVSVWLDDSTHVVRTDDQGHYRFVNVAAGTHRVTVRYVGYGRVTRVVTVGEETVTLNVTLAASINTLDQVVVTATGAQRVRELGHVVSQINADSLVKEAPITNMADLLKSRVPGLQVITGNGGMAGGEISLRLRGTSTFTLDPEPIVIVDGVRYKHNNLIPYRGFMSEDTRGNGGELDSPLNDLNPNDIATVEVVKGPSASTLYGPDAANGVIVITTKQGTAGPTRFKWYARPVTQSVPKREVEHSYQAWGHDSSGALWRNQCTVLYQYAYGLCILDSITVRPTTVSSDRYSMTSKSRPTWQYGASVDGGVSSFLYYLSGNYNTQTGVLQISPAAQDYLRRQLGVSTLPDEVENPNKRKMLNGNGKVTTNITSKGSATLTANYTQTDRSTANAFIYSQQLQSNLYPGVDTTNVTRFGNPTFALYRSSEDNTHFTPTLIGTAQPLAWLSANATVGLDFTSTVTHAARAPRQSSPNDGGQVRDDRRNQQNRTLTGGITALAHPGLLSFRSSVGVQYNYSHMDGLSANGSRLAPGSTSIGTAASISVAPFWNEIASLGTYGEEVVGVHDRLFLTGSLRLDGSTSFGDAYHARPYPKIGLSWIASDEPFLKNVPGLRELRFRSSYGAASRYPTTFQKLGENGGSAITIEGKSQTFFSRSFLANPYLHPERTREFEYGADITLLSNITVGLTWNSRRTDDQIQLLTYPDGLPPGWGNVGDLKAHGFEASVGIPVFEARGMRADVNLAYAYQTDKILSLGGLPEFKNNYGTGYAIGFPMSSVFGQVITGVADTVGGHADHIIFPNEVIRDTAFRFIGVTVPPRTLTVTPTFSMFSDRIRISTLFDRESGFVKYDDVDAFCASSGLCLAPFLTTTPELIQARYTNSNYREDWTVPGDFTRWRELNVTFDLPARFFRVDFLHLAFSHASVSLQGRNLMLWTKFHGLDPESVNFPRSPFNSSDSNGIPQARAWSFRFDFTP